ncbi:MAG: hypothetical protein Q8M76_06650, partial [Spirochaetaceae bacterium]|nr:hypothetical protein [Spirochaetaceae bacterium]
MRDRRTRSLATAVLALALFVQLQAATVEIAQERGDLGISEFPESAVTRSRYWESFFAAPIPALLARAPAIVTEGSSRFRLYAIKQGEYVYAIAAALGSEDGNGEKPLYAQGTWIVKRSARDGRMIQAKVFLRSDPGAFARIYPDGDRSELDLVLYGGVANREVPIAQSFERVCAASMSHIVAWTSSLASWELLEPRTGLYRDLRGFIAAVRSRLPSLAYGDDGALDSAGSPVYIATGEPQRRPFGLNCSGFAKWIVDGLYKPLTGTYLDPREMAQRHQEDRNGSLSAAVEEELDPFFGLDWTRNLARALDRAHRPGTKIGLDANDVTTAPFALLEAGRDLSVQEANAVRVPGGSIPDGGEYGYFPSYIEGVGYPTTGLRPLLYALAMREPGTAYLASISRMGGAQLPGLRRHYHVAVLVPYFEDDGGFG